MTLANAFDSFTAPKRAEKQKAEMEAAIKKAFDDGKLEGLSLREEVSAGDADGDTTPSFRDALLGRKTHTLTDTEGKPVLGEDAFVKHWQSTGGFTRNSQQH